jgi:hypothetical protein
LPNNLRIKSLQFWRKGGGAERPLTATHPQFWISDIFF